MNKTELSNKLKTLWLAMLVIGSIIAILSWFTGNLRNILPIVAFFYGMSGAFYLSKIESSKLD